MACPGHDSSVAKDDKADGAKTAEKTKAKKDTTKPDKAKSKAAPKKDVTQG